MRCFPEREEGIEVTLIHVVSVQRRISDRPILHVTRSWDDTLPAAARLDEAESCRASWRNGTARFPSERDYEDRWPAYVTSVATGSIMRGFVLGFSFPMIFFANDIR